MTYKNALQKLKKDSPLLFTDTNSAYYNVITALINEMIHNDYLNAGQVLKICSKYGYDETGTYFLSSLNGEEHSLGMFFSDTCEDEKGASHKEYMTSFTDEIKRPLSLLEKSWLKAVSLDPRIRLFESNDLDLSWLEDTEPLFTKEDIFMRDVFTDGDDYTDENYICVFRKLLSIVRDSATDDSICAEIDYDQDGDGAYKQICIKPIDIEYSEKDDKFRLCGFNMDDQYKRFSFFNISKITRCRKTIRSVNRSELSVRDREWFEIEVSTAAKTNAYERVMISFEHYEKDKPIAVDDQTYRINMYYYHEDLAEVVSKIMQFGPDIKVLSPDSFVQRIKNKLKAQLKLSAGL